MVHGPSFANRETLGLGRRGHLERVSPNLASIIARVRSYKVQTSGRPINEPVAGGPSAVNNLVSASRAHTNVNATHPVKQEVSGTLTGVARAVDNQSPTAPGRSSALKPLTAGGHQNKGAEA